MLLLVDFIPRSLGLIQLLSRVIVDIWMIPFVGFEKQEQPHVTALSCLEALEFVVPYFSTFWDYACELLVSLMIEVLSLRIRFFLTLSFKSELRLSSICSFWIDRVFPKMPVFFRFIMKPPTVVPSIHVINTIIAAINPNDAVILVWMQWHVFS